MSDNILCSCYAAVLMDISLVTFSIYSVKMSKIYFWMSLIMENVTDSTLFVTEGNNFIPAIVVYHVIAAKLHCEMRQAYISLGPPKVWLESVSILLILFRYVLSHVLVFNLLL